MKLIHEIFIKITHLGKKINTMYTSLLKTVYHHTKKGLYFGKSISNLWQVLLSEINPQNNTF